MFDFDTLFKIDAIIQLQGHELFSLLRVFLSGGLEDYKKWESEHPGSTEKYGDRPYYRVSRGLMLTFEFWLGLDEAQLERKIRLLTLTSLGFQNIGKGVSYATLASALKIDESEVEKWVIDGAPSPSHTRPPHRHHFSDPCWLGIRKTLSILSSLPYHSFDLTSFRTRTMGRSRKTPCRLANRFGCGISRGHLSKGERWREIGWRQQLQNRIYRINSSNATRSSLIL